MTGSGLEWFGSLKAAVTYCNRNSRCTGINDWYCDGNGFIPNDGTPEISTKDFQDTETTCAWVMKLKS